MLTMLFESLQRMQALHACPNGSYLEDFAAMLDQAGYAKITARRHMRAAEHFLYWVAREDLPIADLSEAVLSRFDRHLPRCRCPGFGRSSACALHHGPRLLVSHLRAAHGITAPVAPPSGPDAVVFADFCQWMRAQRGTMDSTLANYWRPIRDAVQCLGGDFGQWDARGLREFILERSQGSGRTRTKQCTTALRLFLRFLIAHGRCPVGLDAAIPVVARWRLAALPHVLPPADVERIIASCDKATPAGIRDRAILLLLARLALRAGDIVMLRLQDIDWRSASIMVSGKAKRQTQLPLSQEVGQAVADYLQNARPLAASDRLFVCIHAPHRPLGSHCAVSAIVARAIIRAGVQRPARGAAHLLRHSAAAAMLRHGASLQDIAALLRHRSITTTQIYAKVDVNALARITQPWPNEVSPC
ncbi:MAG: tyrosine-type recombinase/integrase [Acidiferrobacter sp.]